MHQSGSRRVDRRGSHQLPSPQRRRKGEKGRASVRKGEKRRETGSTESHGLGRLEREIADSDSSTYKLSSTARSTREVVFSVMPLRDCCARSTRVEETRIWEANRSEVNARLSIGDRQMHSKEISRAISTTY